MMAGGTIVVGAGAAVRVRGVTAVVAGMLTGAWSRRAGAGAGEQGA